MTVILIVAVFIVFLNNSFGYFKKRIEGTKLTFNVGTLNYELECVDLENCEVVIPANQSELVNLNLTSLNKIDTKYELYYEIVSPTDTENIIDGGHLLTEDLTNIGEISKNDTKNVSLVLNNTGNDEVTLKLGIAPSLKNNEPELEENQVSLNGIAYQKYYVYDYTGDYETFVAPTTGTYKIELWGAQGGSTNSSYPGGKGAYTSGVISLNNNQELFVYVGQNSTSTTDITFNNGSLSQDHTHVTDNGYHHAGGGSTDVRLKEGTWDNFESIKSRIMVAAGGGGTQTYYSYFSGGAAGGLIGYSGSSTGSDGKPATGGTQTSGGENGLGSNTPEAAEKNSFGKVIHTEGETARGGNGYYAGGNGPHGGATVGSGAGGSSFISGHDGCDAITEETTEENIIHSGKSTHYSGYYFTDTVMIDGKGYSWTTEVGKSVDMPTHDLTSTMTGNTGNGYARITLIEAGESTGYVIKTNDKIGLYYEVPANYSKEIDLSLTNTNLESSYYELYYEVIYPTDTSNIIDGGYISTSENTANGFIEAKETKNLSFVINNTGENTLYIKIGATKNSSSDETQLGDNEVSLNRKVIQKYYVYEYSGDYQTFVASQDGYYDVELWGAQGTEYGGYTKGMIQLNKNQTLYVYVGEKGNKNSNFTNFNGGTSNYDGTNGGGATDIRLETGSSWQDFSSLKTRIMVAAGGGSGVSVAGAAGGLIGYAAGTLGGTQISTESSWFAQSYFGIANGGCTGGNGYYPAAGAGCAAGSGGGSSFISGHEGCNAITEGSTSTSIVHTNQANHYSGYVFSNTKMIDGQGYEWTNQKGNLVNMPTHDLISTMIGNAGDGYARITYLGNDTYTIQYNANGGQGTMEDNEVYISQEFTLAKNIFKKEGYGFAGWSLSRDNDEVVYNDMDIIESLAKKDEIITLYAVWIEDFDVNFDANGGSVTPVSKLVSYHSMYGELPTPTREGYIFIGWFDEKYKDNPLNYYSDDNPDLYSAFGYDENKLYTHWIQNGINEGRRVSQYLATDIVTKTSSHVLYAGWKAS